MIHEPPAGWDELDGPPPSLYEQAPGVGDSWRAQNLLDYAANPEPGPTIGAAIYAGKRHLCSGESESGKSWLALAWCVEVLRAGGSVVYVDHEMGRSMTLERLHVLAATDDDIPRFRYVDPSEPANFAAPQIAELVAGVTLVIIDATIGSLSLHALDENSTTDIERWYQRVVDPLRATGAAVVVLDHVTKNPDTRGKYAIGSQRKVGASDVHLSVECVKPFGRTQVGLAKVTVKKDRPGHLPRPTLGTFKLDPASDQAYTWEPYTGEQGLGADGRPRLTGFMERVSRWLEAYGPGSQNDIEGGVKGRREHIRSAIDSLISEGFAASQLAIGKKGGGAEITHLKPYREADDSNQTTPEIELRPTAPNCAPGAENGTAPSPRLSERAGRSYGAQLAPELRPLETPCPNCSAKGGNEPYETAGGTYCCHDCARGEACACKYQAADA